jgi:hypothetical protein
MSRRAKRGRLKMGPTELADDLGRYVLDSGHARERGRNLINDLFAEGFIHGDGEGGFEILEPCWCPPGDFLTFSADRFGARPESATVAARAAEMAGGNRVVKAAQPPKQSDRHRSRLRRPIVNNGNCVPTDPYSDAPWLRGDPTARLVREVFPQMCQECGIHLLPDFEWHDRARGALAGSFNRWHEKDHLDLAFIEDMIWEFGRHRQWCVKSNREAWRVLLSRKDELRSLVLAQRRRFGVSGERDNPSRWLEHDPAEAHRDDVGWWLDETRRPVTR